MAKTAHHDRHDVFQYYEADTADQNRRLVYPHENVTEEIIAAFSRLREDGKFITLVDGAFDVPQADYEWYLRHCRSLGAAALLEKYDQEQTPENIKWIMESGGLKLAVTVDADQSSGSSWQARAERVAAYTYKAGAGRQPVVDLVTVKGDALHAGTALESSPTLAHHLGKNGLLDALIINGRQDDVINEAHSLGLDPIVIPDEPIELLPS